MFRVTKTTCAIKSRSWAGFALSWAFDAFTIHLKLILLTLLNALIVFQDQTLSTWSAFLLIIFACKTLLRACPTFFVVYTKVPIWTKVHANFLVLYSWTLIMTIAFKQELAIRTLNAVWLIPETTETVQITYLANSVRRKRSQRTFIGTFHFVTVL